MSQAFRSVVLILGTKLLVNPPSQMPSSTGWCTTPTGSNSTDNPSERKTLNYVTKRQKTDIKNQGLTATRQSWADTPVQMGGCCRNRWADIPEYALDQLRWIQKRRLSKRTCFCHLDSNVEQTPVASKSESQNGLHPRRPLWKGWHQLWIFHSRDSRAVKRYRVCRGYVRHGCAHSSERRP